MYKKTTKFGAVILAAVISAGSAAAVTASAADEPQKETRPGIIGLAESQTARVVQSLTYKYDGIYFTIPDGVTSDGVSINISGRSDRSLDGIGGSVHFLEGKTFEAGNEYGFSTANNFPDFGQGDGDVLEMTLRIDGEQEVTVDLLPILKAQALRNSLNYKDGVISFTVPKGVASKDVFVHIAGQSQGYGTVHYLEQEGYDFTYEAGKTYSFSIENAFDKDNLGAVSGGLLLDVAIAGGENVQVDLIDFAKASASAADSVKLAAPVVTAATVSSTRIALSWNKIDGAEKYTVYYKKTGTTDKYKLYGGTAKTSATITKLDTATRYSFIVKAYVKQNGKTIYGAQSKTVLSATGGAYKKAATVQELKPGVDDSKITYTYDKNGNVITEKTTDIETKQVWTTQYTYNKNNLVLTIKSTEPDGSVSRNVTYTYDANGRLTTFGDYDNENYHDYTYDDKGNLLSDTSFVGGKVYTKDLYTYTAGGNVFTHITQNADGKKDHEITYNYDKNGNTLTEMYYDGAGNSVWIIDYTYDDKGNMLTATEKDSDGTVTGYKYTYSNSGNLLSDEHSTYGKWGSGKFVYTYDSNGNRLSWTGYDANGKQDSNVYTYAYDKTGNLLTFTTTNHNGVFVTKYTY